MQKKIVRVINSSSFRAHTKPLFFKDKILDIFDINVYLLTIFMHKALNPDKPNMFTSFYSTNREVHGRDTRIADDLRVRYGKTNVLNFSVKITGAEIWNSIPHVIRKERDENKFKKNIKEFLVTRKDKLIVGT